MRIEQFEDKGLAQYSYAILSECEKAIILIDPSRNPQPYYDYAEENKAVITGVIETHPHADFVSSHLEIANTTGATIYASAKVNASYPHQTFDEDQSISIGKIKLTALNTPGHSPDSICVLLEHEGVQRAVFTGDTLFIGDCGRPDLRESTGSIQLSRTELAKMLFHSLHKKLMLLNDDTIVYPAHGAGTLCGKNISDAAESTIGIEKKTNWSLQPQTEDAFINTLLANQPSAPAYFPFDVELNRKGAAPFKESVSKVSFNKSVPEVKQGVWIIDIRAEADFKSGSLSYSVNLMSGLRFETWLGSIIQPEEIFYLAGSDEEELRAMIERAAAIGYESQIEVAFILKSGEIKQDILDKEDFRKNPDKYTIVDVRNENEAKNENIFDKSILIPLGQLRYRINEIPKNKPIVVHCAGGYRSAAGSSLIRSHFLQNIKVYDLGEAIKDF